MIYLGGGVVDNRSILMVLSLIYLEFGLALPVTSYSILHLMSPIKERESLADLGMMTRATN